MLSCVSVFHFLVLLQIIPYTIVWGARIQNTQQMLALETVSLLLNLFILAVVLLKAGYLTWKVHPTAIRLLLWLFAALFAINTLGNLFSNNFVEAVIFTPLTLLLAVLFVRLALEPFRVKDHD